MGSKVQDLSMMVPDRTILAKALTTVAKFVAENADTHFRTQLLRSSLGIDGQPGLLDVVKYHQHLQAETESMIAARTVIPAPVPAVKALGTTPISSSAPSGTTSKPECKYFLKQGVSSCGFGIIFDYFAYECPEGHQCRAGGGNAAAKVAGAQPPNPKSPSVSVMALRKPASTSDELAMFALVDLGSTHALWRATSQEEWEESDQVTVNLAGGESIGLRMNAAGTILVPINSMTSATSASPIVPLGALVSQLGYTMTWGKTKCKLEGKNGEVIVLRVREGCPEVTEQEASRLISQLEGARLQELRRRTADTRTRVKAAALAMERTCFDYLISYVDGEITSQALKVVERRESDCGRLTSGLFTCMLGSLSDVLFNLEGHGYTILELDIERVKYRASAGFWGPEGKDCSDRRHPPQSTFMISRHVVGGPEPVRSNEYPFENWPGRSDSDVWTVNRETKLITRMIYLHALATAGRLRAQPDPESSREAAFLLEHTRDPRGYLKFQDPLYPDVVSLWRTSLWTEYALEAGLQTYSFDMTLGTNLHLRHLDGLRMRWHSDGSVPVKVRRGHLPFRADCAICVQAGGTGRKHSRVEHPSAFVVSADLSGIMKVAGVDPNGRGAFPRPFKYIFAAKLRAPKNFVEDGRRVWLDYDPGEVSKEDYEEQDDGLAAADGEDRGEEDPRDDGGEDMEPELKEVPRRDPEEDIDLGGPEFVNLIFARGLKDEKAPTVLERVQDVILYCMDYRARATQQWRQGEGIRVTTTTTMAFGCECGDIYAKWLSGAYVGLSDSLSKGHLVYVNDDDRAENLIREVARLLPEDDRVYGMCRHGGRIGVTKSTVERPWFARLLNKVTQERAPDAKYAAIYVSMNNEREVHIDRNNALGAMNHVLPISMARRRGELWMELRDGDVVSGKVIELVSGEGRARYGCAFPLQEGRVFSVDPDRRHAVMPWAEVYINALSVSSAKPAKEIEKEAVPLRGGGLQEKERRATFRASCGDWEMQLVLDDVNESAQTAALSSSDGVRPTIRKAEVTYVDRIEELLAKLTSPVSVVYTANPKDVVAVFEKWIPSLKKEVNTLDSGKGQLIPVKVVYTIKPPDPCAEEENPSEMYKRKSRIVICGNMAPHCPSEVFASTAPAEVVPAAIASSERGIAGARVVLARAGLARPGELWRLTHAVYGLQESPKLWGSYRDTLLAQIQLAFDGKPVTLLQGILVVYVDDLLLCGRTELIKELAAAIKAIWKTSPLQLVTEGEIRFLGIEISLTSQGFALSQRAYIEEQMTSRRKDLVPVAKESASSAAADDEGPANEGEVRAAQQIAGELLWISQQTRPDIAFVCSLIGSLGILQPEDETFAVEETRSYEAVMIQPNMGW
ncbi:TY5A [Symbiodinium sp. CCMP2592]|nr:TY5A [Symbiodinium sp. CCMP2592]